MTMCHKSIKNFKNLPKLIVFDLDYTLWPLWVDTHVDLPFKKLPNGTVQDRHGTEVKLYKDVVPILDAMATQRINVAVASRTGATDVAESLLEIMDLNKYFVRKEIYPGSKVAHFSKFTNNLEVSYKDMLFFDDEERNIRDLSGIGVTAIHAPNGLCWELFHHGLSEFSKKMS